MNSHLFTEIFCATLLHERLERYMEDLRTLLIRVRRLGYEREKTLVELEAHRANESESPPQELSEFSELGRLQLLYRRDVCIIEAHQPGLKVGKDESRLTKFVRGFHGRSVRVPEEPKHPAFPPARSAA